jgi:MOSC domain-containing protein YiiM
MSVLQQGRLPLDSPLARLFDAPMRPGRLAWIGLRPARRAPMVAVTEAMLLPGAGLAGDRWRGAATGARQVTLVGAAHLRAIADFLGLDAVAPERLRRNLVVEGVNLLALKGRRFRIGDALLEHSGECHPCSRMEEEFGAGGYNAVRGHGGITARVIAGGPIRIGDAVQRAEATPPGP